MADNIFMKRFAELIQLRGYSQKEIAQRTHLTESAVSRYLSGERVPKGAILLNIANTLGTSTEYLQGKTDEVKPADADNEVEKAMRIVARNAKNLTAEERERFIRILYEGEKVYDKIDARQRL